MVARHQREEAPSSSTTVLPRATVVANSGESGNSSYRGSTWRHALHTSRLALTPRRSSDSSVTHRRSSDSAASEVHATPRQQQTMTEQPELKRASTTAKKARKLSLKSRRRKQFNVHFMEHGERSAVMELAMALVELCSTGSWAQISAKIKELKELAELQSSSPSKPGSEGSREAVYEAIEAEASSRHSGSERSEKRNAVPQIISKRGAAPSSLGAWPHFAGKARKSSAEKLGGTELFDPDSSEIDGYLIDLDGTMYQPGGLIEGAREFYQWLKRSGKPYVFLSNTGAKNAKGVQAKFASPNYLLDDEPVPLECIHTAAEAQVDFMLATVPPHARLLVITGGEEPVWRDDLRRRGGARGAALYETWQIRTQLSDDEAKEWAACSACSKLTKLVWVAFFTDGEICRATGEREGFSDWGFSVIKTAGFLLSHGAQFIYTADDAYNPSIDPRHPGLMFPLPGPGMFAEMMKKLMYPHGKDYIWCAGKGGNVGDEYMMEQGLRMLQKQGHSGERSRIMMVGDRFDTDIRAGLSVGIRTCLVTSGCHVLDCQQYYRMDPTHYYAPSVLHLAPPAAVAAAEAAAPSAASLREASGKISEKLLQDLRAWTLAQGNLLRPTSAESAREELPKRLGAYFNSVDLGSGVIELEQVLPALDMLGLQSHHLEPRSPGKGIGGKGGDGAAAAAAETTSPKLRRFFSGGGLERSLREYTSPAGQRSGMGPFQRSDTGGSLGSNARTPGRRPFERSGTGRSNAADCDSVSFSRHDRSEFMEVVETALSKVGIDARKRWAAGKRKATMVSFLMAGHSSFSGKSGTPGSRSGESGESEPAAADEQSIVRQLVRRA